MDLKEFNEKEIKNKKTLIWYYKSGWLSLLVIIIMLYLSMLWRIIFLNQSPIEYVDIFAATNIGVVAFLVLAQRLDMFNETNLHNSIIRHTLLVGVSMLIINLLFFGTFSIAFFISSLAGLGVAWILSEIIIKRLP